MKVRIDVKTAPAILDALNSRTCYKPTWLELVFPQKDYVRKFWTADRLLQGIARCMSLQRDAAQKALESLSQHLTGQAAPESLSPAVSTQPQTDKAAGENVVSLLLEAYKGEAKSEIDDALAVISKFPGSGLDEEDVIREVVSEDIRDRAAAMALEARRGLVPAITALCNRMLDYQALSDQLPEDKQEKLPVKRPKTHIMPNNSLFHRLIRGAGKTKLLHLHNQEDVGNYNYEIEPSSILTDEAQDKIREQLQKYYPEIINIVIGAADFYKANPRDVQMTLRQLCCMAYGGDKDKKFNSATMQQIADVIQNLRFVDIRRTYKGDAATANTAALMPFYTDLNGQFHLERYSPLVELAIENNHYWELSAQARKLLFELNAAANRDNRFCALSLYFAYQMGCWTKTRENFKDKVSIIPLSDELEHLDMIFNNHATENEERVTEALLCAAIVMVKAAAIEAHGGSGHGAPCITKAELVAGDDRDVIKSELETGTAKVIWSYGGELLPETAEGLKALLGSPDDRTRQQREAAGKRYVTKRAAYSMVLTITAAADEATGKKVPTEANTNE